MGSINTKTYSYSVKGNFFYYFLDDNENNNKNNENYIRLDEIIGVHRENNYNVIIKLFSGKNIILEFSKEPSLAKECVIFLLNEIEKSRLKNL